MKIMRVLSLFDGISCGHVALDRAGINVETYYASEIDKNAIKITQQNYPNTIQLGDITKIDFNQYVGKIDILFGGFPCQDLSICKKDRKGLDGSRSGLFFTLLNAIKIVKPKYFLIENVASMTDENKQIISKHLGVEPIYIDSAEISAQSRKRLYWTNIPFLQQNKIYNKNKMYLYQILESESPEIFLKYAINAKFHNSSHCVNSKSGRGGKPNLQPSIQNRIYDVFGKSTALTTSYRPYIAEPTHDKPIQIGNMARIKDDIVINNQGSRVYSVSGKSVTLKAMGGGWGAKSGLYKIDLPDGNYYIRKLTPIESERLQTLPDNYTNCVSDSARLKALGNGWTVDTIAWILRGINTTL